MITRLLTYFFYAFFTSAAAGFSPNLDRNGWTQLLFFSFASAFGAVKAFLDKTSGGPPAAPTNYPGTLAVLVAAGVLFFFTGCGSAAYYPNGKKAVQTYSNAKGFHFKGGGIELSADELDHATPTKAATAGATSILTAAGAAVAGVPLR